MKQISFLLFIFLFACNFFADAQLSNNNKAFRVGEKLEYEIAYNWGFIWLPAGTVTFQLKTDYFQGQNVYHLNAFGITYKTYDWFFKVRDYFQSYVDTLNFAPLWAERNTNDGGYKAYENYVFNAPLKKIFVEVKTSEKFPKHDTLKMLDGLADVLTAAYQIRNRDYSGYKINDKIPIWVLIDGKAHPLYIRYLGKEVITLRDNRKFNCLKLASLLIEGTVFKGGEDLTVWISDDDNHIPIVAEAKIIVGSVKAVFINSENLRSPLNVINN